LSSTAAPQQTIAWARITMTGPAPMDTPPAQFADQVADALARDGRSADGIAGLKTTHVRCHPESRPALTGETGRVALVDVKLTFHEAQTQGALTTALKAHLNQEWGISRHCAAGVQICRVDVR
jgi:hypothetical protein